MQVIGGSRDIVASSYKTYHPHTNFGGECEKCLHSNRYITIPPIEHIGFERCGGLNCTEEKIYFPDSYKSYSIRLYHEPKLVHDGHYHKIQYPENFYISYLIIDDIYFFEGGLIDFRWIQTCQFSKLNINHHHSNGIIGEHYCKQDCYRNIALRGRRR